MELQEKTETNERSITNKVEVSGIIVAEPKEDHEVMGEKFFALTLQIKRLSNEFDFIPVIASQQLTEGLSLGDNVKIEGQFRSYNKMEGERSRLILSVFAQKLEKTTENENLNRIALVGFICKPTIFRETPFNREIGDMLLAVNRAYNKSDYIPCIAWGRNARTSRDLSIGSCIKIFGRIQSREYQKREGEELVAKTAYEVSIAKLEVLVSAAESAESVI